MNVTEEPIIVPVISKYGLPSSAPMPADSRQGDYVVRYSTKSFKVIELHTSSGTLLDAPSGDGDFDELSLSEGAYEMANLQPEETGLSFVVWISPKGGARHAARVKVSDIPNTSDSKASVSIHPPVEVKAGSLSSEELEKLAKWIDLNREPLLQFWDGNIQYTSQILSKLQSI